MDETMKQRLTNRDLWLRAVFMVLFAIAYSIAELVIVLVVVVQFLVVLFSGAANRNLLVFGQNLSTYVYQILRFETFNAETRPYPFAPWPSASPGDNPWSEGAPSEAVSGMSSAADEGTYQEEMASTGGESPTGEGSSAGDGTSPDDSQERRTD